MCRVVGKVVLEMRDLGQEPKHIVIAGVLRIPRWRTAKIQRSALTVEAMEKSFRPFRALTSFAGGSGNHEADPPDGNVAVVGHHRFVVMAGNGSSGYRLLKV